MYYRRMGLAGVKLVPQKTKPINHYKETIMIKLYRNNMLYGYGDDRMLSKYIRKGYTVEVCKGENHKPIIDVDEPILLVNEVKKTRTNIISRLRNVVDNTISFFKYAFTPITAASLAVA